jgi:hypothetical protein
MTPEEISKDFFPRWNEDVAVNSERLFFLAGYNLASKNQIWNETIRTVPSDPQDFKESYDKAKTVTGKFPLTEEEAFKKDEADQQVRENLSYYIGQADTFQKERDMWRDNFFKQSEVVEELEGTIKLQNDELSTRADVISKLEVDLLDVRSKLLTNANGWQYAVDQSISWKQKYEFLKQETENVADFFAKYERRVI